MTFLSDNEPAPRCTETLPLPLEHFEEDLQDVESDEQLGMSYVEALEVQVADLKGKLERVINAYGIAYEQLMRERGMEGSKAARDKNRELVQLRREIGLPELVGDEEAT